MGLGKTTERNEVFSQSLVGLDLLILAPTEGWLAPLLKDLKSEFKTAAIPGSVQHAIVDDAFTLVPASHEHVLVLYDSLETHLMSAGLCGDLPISALLQSWKAHCQARLNFIAKFRRQASLADSVQFRAAPGAIAARALQRAGVDDRVARRLDAPASPQEPEGERLLCRIIADAARQSPDILKLSEQLSAHSIFEDGLEDMPVRARLDGASTYLKELAGDRGPSVDELNSALASAQTDAFLYREQQSIMQLELEQALQSYRQAQAANAAKDDSAKELLKSIAQLKGEKAAQQQSINKLEAKLADKTTEIGALQHRVEQSEIETKTVRENFIACQGELESLRSEFSASRAEAEGLHADILTCQSDAVGYRNDIAHLQRDLDKQRAETTSRTAEKDDLSKRLSLLSRQKELIEADATRLRESLQAMYKSSSWRLTAPLRVLMRRLGRRRAS